MEKIRPKKVLEHIFQNFQLKFEIQNWKEKQPGLMIEYVKITANKDFVNLPVFELGIKNIAKYSFGYKNWIFVPENGNYYLMNLKTGNKYHQIVWFRENGINYKDYLIKNYFKDNKHYTVNNKSNKIFDLITFETITKKH